MKVKKDVNVAGAYFNICIKGDLFTWLNLIAKSHGDSTQETLEQLIEIAIIRAWND